MYDSEYWDKWRACEACDLCSERQNVVLGDGDPNANVMVIADKPGITEDAVGIPMAGNAGLFYHSTLASCGETDFYDVWTTNCVACVTPDNQDPTIPQLEACRERLLAEIRSVDPYVIVLMGRVTVEHLLGVKKSISKLQLKTYLLPLTFQDDHGNEHTIHKLCIVTYNPGWIQRHPSKARNQPWHFFYRAIKQALLVAKTMEDLYNGGL